MLAFLSHNSKDKPTARDIGLFLTAEGIGVWFDEWDIQAGESIPTAIDEALAKCSHVILVWSANAKKSNWVRAELSAAISAAISTGSPTVIPVVLGATPLPPLVAHLKHIQYGGGTEADRRSIIRGVSGSEPTITFIQAIVRKYHEVVSGGGQAGRTGHTVCLECGSDDLSGSTYTSDRDKTFDILKCNECGWLDWTG